MLRRRTQAIAHSRLLDQDTFYQVFIGDIQRSKHEVIIESPFITKKRLAVLIPTLCDAVDRGVCVIVNTKPLENLGLSAGQEHKNA